MIFWLVYVILEAFIQAKSIKAGNNPIYILLFIIRGIASITHGILLNVQYGTWEYPVLLGFQICSFYVIFDFLLNFFRKEPNIWSYRGLNSGKLDRLPLSYWYALKAICLIGAIIFYILGLNYWNY